MSRRRSLPIWILWYMCLTVTAVGTVLALTSSYKAGTAPDRLLTVVIPVGFLAFPTVGAIVTSRDHGNVIGWLFLAVGLVSALGPAADAYAAFKPPLPGAPYAALVDVATIGSPAIMAFFAFFLLLFPDGRVPTRRWRPFARYGVGVTATVVLYAVFVQPRLELNDGQKLANPVAIGPLAGISGAIESVLYPALIVCVPLAAVSFILRFRRSRGVEREQMKWFASSAVLLAVIVGLSPLAFNSRAPTWLWPLMFLLGTTSVPVAAGIAILRYRLYDIDRVISRTVSYAIVTAVLVGAYVGLVIVFESMTRPITGRSDLAVAASTLIAAAMFVPLRSRVQNAVDHRFNRKRYDAERTIESFSGRLRDEVDIQTLQSDLEAIVRQTMQPVHLSVWLRDRPT